jgi:AraC family transcriptional regulator, regulatory protein of adaptative response / DNA-3-methyladenine glycosylase II
MDTELAIHLPYRAPLESAALFAFLERRAVPGVEEVAGGAYRRSLRLAGGPAVIELRPGPGCIRASVRLAGADDLADAIARCRRLLDLDADPAEIVGALGDDPVVGYSVRAAPGLRVPGHVDPDELGIRAVLGQQVSLGAAATVAGRLARAHGEALAAPCGSVTHLFPSPQTLAELDPAALPMPASRGRALVALARSLAGGELALDPGADPAAVRAQLLGLPGIGRWTADYIVMRGLGDRDVFPAADLWIRRALRLRNGDGSGEGQRAMAERWRPYRAYAAQHLWAGLGADAVG